MRIFGLGGDDSDFSLHVHQGRGDRWYYDIRDAEGTSRLVPTFRGVAHGFDTQEDAIADAREVVEGLGADFSDLDMA